MSTKPSIPGNPEVSIPQPGSAPASLRLAWLSIRSRILGGVVLVLPIAITIWLIYWVYLLLDQWVIDPLARLLLKLWGDQSEVQLPYWFEKFAAPAMAVCIALLLLYLLGFFINSRLRRAFDWVLLRVPVISTVYDAVRKVFGALEMQPGKQRAQRLVLVEFPHPGMKVPAFVTSTCRDIATQKVILCVYVPTTPVPTSGYFLLVPESSVTDLNWGTEQSLQAIISAGFTAPPDVSYYSTRPAIETHVAPTP